MSGAALTDEAIARLRAHGPVRLPDPPGGARTCADALAALVDRFADMGSPS